MKRIFLSFVLSCAIALPLAGQSNGSNPPQYPGNNDVTPSSPSPSATDDRGVPANQDQPAQFHYRVRVTERSTQAVDYRDRGGTTQVDFKGTSLMPAVDGRAKVTGHTGRLAVNVSLHHLKPARDFGPEYLTYVLWAITPEGRATNLGEVVPNGDGNVDVQVTSGLQEFGLIVTAEPYFAVTRPSDLVVAENIVRPDTEGGIHPITARYELLQKGQYTVDINIADLPATPVEHVKNKTLQILEAENAIAIAEAVGADQYAPDTIQKAKDYLGQAQEYERRHQGSTPIGTVARAAVESAEDARLITMQKKQQEFEAAQRQKEQERIQQAQTEAQRESIRAQEARDEAQRQADQRAAAEQERVAAEQARAQAEQAQQEAQQEAQQAAAAQAQAQQQLQQAQQAQQQLAQQAQQSQLQAQQADQARVQAEQQAEQQRQRLLQQLNQVLQTKDTAKGLIVNVSDVLFDTGQSTLKPGAKVRLAKVAGIILAYPDLQLEVDGYTDSVGGDDFNQRLSERRADAVRDFLVSQGVAANNVTARGYGKGDPIASNDTAAGRQLNRRVEMVVNGSAIGQNGSPAGAATYSPSTVTGGVAGAATTTTTPSSPPPANPGSVAAPVASPPPTTTPNNTTTVPTTSVPPGTNTVPSNTSPPPLPTGQQPPE
jgi:outer membrane protein OmpA-like peptidoglycan-associated protein